MTTAHSDMHAFHALLRRITAHGREPRILAVCGAGLSAASGLPTFRGSTKALWHTHDPMTLATPEAFAANPGLVWRFYAYRRHMALQARPNAGHYALAALARAVPNFLCLTQNVDGLSPRAGHPPRSLRTLHGSLLDIRCVACDYVDPNNCVDPVHPSLDLGAPEDGSPEDSFPDDTATGRDPHTPPASLLPHCPQCAARGQSSLLRPGVVWFGERLDESMLDGIEAWLAGGGRDAKKVDLVMVIGTTAEVQPAASFIDDARDRGAAMAVVNVDADTAARQRQMQLDKGDFAFAGSAAELLPVMLEPVIGKLSEGGEARGAKTEETSQADY